MARGRMIAATVADDKRMGLQNGLICAMMVPSEQVLGTHLVANVSGVFCCLQLHTCSAQGAPSIDYAATANARVATWVPSLDRRRTLRVLEANRMARIVGNEGGYIYIARGGTTWKIGCTRERTGYIHSLPSKGELAGVHARLRSLRKTTGVPFELFHVIYIPKNLMQFENELHRILDAYRCSSLELFTLPEDALDTIKRITTYAGVAVTHLEVL